MNDFKRFQASRFLATISVQMQSVAIGWQVYEITKSPLSLGIVGLVQFLPIFLMSPISGHTADRHERRSIILICLSVMTLCSLTFFSLTSTGNNHPWIFYALLMVIGVTRSFWAPATHSFLPYLVPLERLPKAIALNSTIWQIAFITGPALGGAVYGWSGKASWTYAGSAFAMAVSFLFMRSVRVRTPKRERGEMNRSELSAGVRYVWKEKAILGAMSLDLFAVLLGGAVALLPIYASDILKVGPQGLGLLRSAPGIGAVLTGLFLAARPLQSRAGLKMLVCVAIFGSLTILFGISTNFLLSLTCLTLMGAVDLVSIVVRQSLIQLRTPDEMRGRVSAVALVFIGASNELGEFESGITAAWFGVVPAVVIGGVGTILVTVVWAFLFPGLRQLDRLTTKRAA